MSRLLRFPYADEDGSDDGFVVVEVEEDEPGVIAVSRLGDSVADAAASFEDGVDRIRQAAASVLGRLRDMPSRPDDVCLEYGVRFSAEVGAVIAKGTGEAHLKVTMTWRSTSGSEEAGARGGRTGEPPPRDE